MKIFIKISGRVFVTTFPRSGHRATNHPGSWPYIGGHIRHRPDSDHTGQQNAVGFSASTFSVQTAEFSGIIFGFTWLPFLTVRINCAETRLRLMPMCVDFLNTTSKSDQGSQFYEEPATSHVNCAEKVNQRQGRRRPGAEKNMTFISWLVYI